METKAADTDPVSVEAPTRSEGDFYQSGLDIEFLQVENNIIEDVNPDPDTTFPNGFPGSFKCLSSCPAVVRERGF